MSDSFLHYTISGRGQAVIFLHGFMENGSMWSELIQQLPVKAYVIDLHGHGSSFFNPNLPESVEMMAEQVMQIVEKEQLQQALVVGHSLGGYVALELFRMNPDFEHVVLFHSNPWSDSLDKQKDRERVASLVKTKKEFFISEAIPNLFYEPNRKPESIGKYKRMALDIPAEAIAWTSLAMKNRTDHAQLLIDHPGKFTCIIGNEDKLVHASLLDSFCQSHGINAVLLKHVGHMAQEEAPALTLDLFRTILG